MGRGPDRDGPRVWKGSGEREPFDERKLRRSLRRSGASPEQIDAAVASVRRELRDGMSTSKVFRLAHRALRGLRRPTAARYALQRAIQELGPSGFPFEHFVGALWQAEGFRVRTGVVLPGRFVRHEVDLDARDGRERVLGECKFRERRDGKVDVKVAMYVHARDEDLRPVQRHAAFWLVTNGRFTSDALAYGAGVGLRLLSWDHPKGDGLRDRIDRLGLHPITCLSSLRAGEKQRLLRQGVVLAAELCRTPALVGELGLGNGRRRTLFAEVEGLCATGPAAGED